MTSFDDFWGSLSAVAPPDVPDVMKALWWAHKGDWQRAHTLVQEIDTVDAAWVHAHLHRQEGDLENARYWYDRAKRVPSSAALDAEWLQIVRELMR